jgi:hypothetical protein
MYVLTLFAMLVAAVILLATVVIMRSTTEGRWVVQLADIGIALVPIFVRLVLTGQLAKLTFGSEGISFAFQKVLTTDIKDIFHFSLPTESLLAQEKPNPSRLNDFIADRTPAMFFVLGKRYSAEVLQQDLTSLKEYPFFRFVVIQQNGGAFFGMMDASHLTDYLSKTNGWDRFIDAVAQPDAAYFADPRLGFVDAAKAVTETTEKAEVLEKMQIEQMDWLPVTESGGKWIGRVEQSAVLARLVLSLDARIRE